MTSDAKNVLGEGLKIGVNHYSEFMSKSPIINVPMMFNALWMFVKLFLDPKTIRKIDMFRNQYMENLLEQMPLESIPERIGGKYTVGSYFSFLSPLSPLSSPTACNYRPTITSTHIMYISV